MTSAVRESFALVGEMFLSRKTNPNYPPVDPANDRGQFGQYMADHLNYIAKFTPVADYCVANNYFILHNGITIRQICDGNGGTVNATNMVVVIQVPTSRSGVTQTYTMVLPKNIDRYTTLYGFTGTAGDWTQADQVLNIAATQPNP